MYEGGSRSRKKTMKQSSDQERERAQKWIFFYPVESPTREYIFQRIQFASKIGEAFEADWTHFFINPKDARTHTWEILCCISPTKQLSTVHWPWMSPTSLLFRRKTIDISPIGRKMPTRFTPEGGREMSVCQTRKKTGNNRRRRKGHIVTYYLIESECLFFPLFSCVYRQRLKAK